MNRRRLLCAFGGLGLGFLFYLAHRSDYTVSNRLLGVVCGPSTYLKIKHELKHWLPIPFAIRGCLPSALWCFVVTSLLGGWSLRGWRNRTLSLGWLCPFFNAGWEGVQAFGWTDGYADWLDAMAGFGGAMIARGLSIGSPEPVVIPSLWSWRLGIVVSSFASMALADVWK